MAENVDPRITDKAGEDALREELAREMGGDFDQAVVEAQRNSVDRQRGLGELDNPVKSDGTRNRHRLPLGPGAAAKAAGTRGHQRAGLIGRAAPRRTLG
ncbi:hypothetical protein [Marinitenerispora sediminis]|uniref:Uncharacterized protein n=1 Tax=Marinitenerispora sediminis TaxID=1931232 RepID=A0A368T6G7_9ACTN|nr:hypothetical protein [Marinitenerispora sediminis]RCV51714.1 hypothetical protein DEF28_14790 [Marinitenerispora sediminis]RCV55097.1 hypothetical protein DEF23_14775 [Marinitenerispora sediminis]RCV59088.1 hypothetical protein DEF24_11070 [Marinitenerispora sediminis]